MKSQLIVTGVTKKLLAVPLSCCAFAAFAELSAEPYTCHWSGAVDSRWWNPSNWQEGIVPGVYVVDNGDGTLSTNGCRGCTAVFGKSNNRLVQANPYATTVDKLKLLSIGHIVVTGAEAPAYEFSQSIGWSWGEPYIPFEGGGSITVDADVTQPILFQSTIILGALDTGAQTFTFENNSQKPLTLRNFNEIAKFSNLSTTWHESYLRFQGSGEIQAFGPTFYPNLAAFGLRLAMSGGCLVCKGNINVIEMRTVAGYGPQRVSIDSGKTLYVYSTNTSIIELPENLTVTGEGKLGLSSGTGANREIKIEQGKVFEMGAELVNTTAGTFAEESAGMRLYSSDGSVFRMTGKNSLSGAVQIENGVIYEADTVGMANAAEPGRLGKGRRIWLSGSARLRYTGAGESSDKTVRMAGDGVVENTGAGRLTLGAVETSAAGNVLKLLAPNGGAFGFAGDIASKLSLPNGGDLAFGGPESIMVSSLTIGGSAVVEVADGCALTLSEIVRTGGFLTVTTAGSGSLKMPGLGEGVAPMWITVNGRHARVAADGTVAAMDGSADYEIDARGGVIPNEAGAVVAITTASGPAGEKVKLAADQTTVAVLRQSESAEAATVVVGEGQKLAAEMFEVADGAQPLVLAGAGSLADEFAVQGGPVIRTNETSDAAVAFDSATGATLEYGGLLTTESPLALGLGNGDVAVSGAGVVPISKFEVKDDAVVTFDGAVFAQADATLSTASPAACGVVGKDSTGVLKFDGGAYTGRMVLASGTTAKAKGAIYLRGGELVNLTVSGASGSSVLGSVGYGYLEVGGGRYVAAGSWRTGEFGQTAIVVTNGTFESTTKTVRESTPAIGGSSDDCLLYVGKGGVFKMSETANNVYIPANGTQNIHSQLTVEDGGSIDFGNTVLYCGYNATSSYKDETVFNINDGGTFCAGFIMRAPANVYKTDDDPCGTAADARRTNVNVLVQFNGGTWRRAGWSPPFSTKVGATWCCAPNRVTVFEKGAVFDTTGSDCGISPGGTFLAPYGKGLESVTLGDTLSGKTFIGPPAVRIVGDGLGASARCDFDAVNGKVTGIAVTGRGNGYTTAEAQIFYGSCDTPIANLPVVLTENVSGGLTKIGTGTLTLSGASTYTGATVVKGGTLSLGIDNAIAAESKLVLDGGTFNVNNKVQTFSDIACNGGTVSNGKPLVSGLRIDMDEVREGSSRSLDAALFDYTDNAVFTIDNLTEADMPETGGRYVLAKFTNGIPEKLPSFEAVQAKLPSFWRVRISGTRLLLARDRGILMIVK